MNSQPSSTQCGPGRDSPQARLYQTTCWTDVFQAGAGGTDEATSAFGRLYRDYWNPVYAFIRRRGYTPEESQDLSQSFFLDLLSRRALQGLRPELGRFRCFLVAALKNFLANARDRAQAQKRGGDIPHLELDTALVERHVYAEWSVVSAEAGFDREWALTMLRRVMERLKQEYAQSGKADLLAEIQGYLGGSGDRPSHAAIAQRHGITANAVGVAIHRLRRRYGELLRQEVARTVVDPADVR